MASHFACEFVCSFENRSRDPLPAIALTENQAIMTAWPNDKRYGFATLFCRQLKALGKPGDVLITLSTSGKSPNCLFAQSTAKNLGIHTVDFPRKGKSTAEIQEYQLHLMHKICREVEKEMFK